MTDSAAAPARNPKRIVFRNTIFGIAAQLGLKAANFLFTIFVVNQLGGSAYGQYQIVLAWAGLISFIGDMGITTYLSREISRDPNRAKDLFWDTVTLRFILAIICTIVTIGAAIAFTDYSNDMILGIGLYTITYFFSIFIAPLGSLLSGNERVDIISILAVVMQVSFMVIAAIFLLLHLDFVWLVLAGPITMPLVLILHIWAVRRYRLGPPRFRVNPDMWWTVLKAGLPFAFIQLAITFALRVDTIVLSSYVSDQMIGWYSTAYNLTLTLTGFAVSFNNALFPTLTREHETNPEVVRPVYYRLVKMILFISLPIAVGGMLTAGKIVGLLYKPEIGPAALPLAIMVWDIPLSMYHMFSSYMSTAIQTERRAARIYITMGVLNLGLNLLLVPLFGIVGAALTTVLTDLVGAALFYFLLRSKLGAGLGFKRLLRVGLAAALMGILILVLRDANLIVIIAVSGVAYLGIIWVSGAFSPDELSLLTGFITRRLRPRTA
jgi:O-antigen/teichoic acid export membrane protein